METHYMDDCEWDVFKAEFPLAAAWLQETCLRAELRTLRRELAMQCDDFRKAWLELRAAGLEAMLSS